MNVMGLSVTHWVDPQEPIRHHEPVTWLTPPSIVGTANPMGIARARVVQCNCCVQMPLLALSVRSGTSVYLMKQELAGREGHYGVPDAHLYTHV